MKKRRKAGDIGSTPRRNRCNMADMLGRSPEPNKGNVTEELGVETNTVPRLKKEER